MPKLPSLCLVLTFLPFTLKAELSSGHGGAEEHHTPEAPESPAEHAATPDEAAADDTLSLQALDQALNEPTEFSDPDEQIFEPISKDAAMAALQRQAWLNARTFQYPQAERQYVELLQRLTDPAEKRQAFIVLSDFYLQAREPIKALSVLDKYVKRFPDGDELPEIFIRMGLLYREQGAYQQGIDSFFSVLKLSFKIDEKEIDRYQTISDRAKFEIAETYYLMGNYQLAADFFERVRRVARNPAVAAEARLKKAYADLLQRRYGVVIENLGAFANDYPDSSRLTESRFVLARAYFLAGRSEDARQEVLNIFAQDVKADPDPTWNQWLMITGNQLANDFYAQKDYTSAHRVYHALLSLSQKPEWRWPIILQIGLCLEGQAEALKAEEIYVELINQTASYEEASTPEADRLRQLRRQAQTRLEHLQWQREFQERLQTLHPAEHAPESEGEVATAS